MRSPIQILVLPCLIDTFSLPHADAPLLCFGRWRKGSFWHEALPSPISDSLIYSLPNSRVFDLKQEGFCGKSMAVFERSRWFNPCTKSIAHRLNLPNGRAGEFDDIGGRDPRAGRVEHSILPRKFKAGNQIVSIAGRQAAADIVKSNCGAVAF